MKETGMSRHIDMLGRFVLPKEIRDSLGIACGDSLAISVEGEKIILQRDGKYCIFCGSPLNTVEYRGKTVCRSCIEGFPKKEA